MASTWGAHKVLQKNEVAEILWNDVTEVKPKIPACTGIHELKERMWNKYCEVAWRKDLGELGFGLQLFYRFQTV